MLKNTRFFKWVGEGAGDELESREGVFHPSLVKILVISVVLVVVFAVLYEYLHPVVVIDNFIVPKAFEEQGYTSQTINNRIKDAIGNIERSTSTLARKESFAMANGSEVPDIVVPETKLSLRTIVQVVQELLRPPHVSGEMTLVPAVSSSPPRDLNLKSRRLLITVRVTNMEDRPPDRFEVTSFKPEEAMSRSGQMVLRLINRITGRDMEDRPPDRFEMTSFKPEEAISRSAQAILSLIDPYLLAAYAYNSEKNPTKALNLISKCHGSLAPWGFLLRGDILYERGDINGVEETLTAGIERYPKFYLFYVNWGIVLLYENHPDDAIAKFQKAIEIDPLFADAYNGWGNALSDKHEPDAAIEKYHKAIELDPNLAAAHNGWGNALSSKNDMEGAILEYQKAIESDSEFANAYDGWGNELLDSRQPDLAISKYKMAIKLNPNLTTVYENWGNALLYKHEPDAAIQKYIKAIELNPKLAYIFNGWGNALRDKHEPDAAILKYKKATQLEPKLAAAYDDWARALEDKHEWDSAKKKYEQAVALEPENKLFRRHLASANQMQMKRKT
jgi:tetratricopeptide (TPR) repeat protein